jgi:hypothetical protein
VLDHHLRRSKAGTVTFGAKKLNEAAETSCIISEAIDMDDSCDFRQVDIRNSNGDCTTERVVVN